MSALPMAAMAVPQTAEERRREAQRLKVLQDWRVFHVNILRKAYTATLEQDTAAADAFSFSLQSLAPNGHSREAL
ncbi:hypothetical protein QFC20_001765 [Naganishia adeliensis]|uniref:Uncharacterized protein n=1 Tax=Naganishia adeliensis TaxID=92952 RepID=A0ACC2WPP7_9TREE|nr:hypothetical protein QFC20_001765 [Naganishia adeliensis]